MDATIFPKMVFGKWIGGRFLGVGLGTISMGKG
jgi:hypothetical protein